MVGQKIFQYNVFGAFVAYRFLVFRDVLPYLFNSFLSCSATDEVGKH